MIGIFVHQHMGQKTRTGAAPLNRARGQRRLCDPLAAGAGHARAHDPVHHEAARNIFQLFGYIFAKAFELAAAGGAGIAHFQNRLIPTALVVDRWPIVW